MACQAMVCADLPLKAPQGAIRRLQRVRWGVVGAVAIFHGIAIFVLIRAFAPDIPQRIARSVTQAFTVVLPEPTPDPAPPPTPASPVARAPDQGRSREAASRGLTGRRAEPRDVAAPSSAIALRPVVLPTLAGTGEESRVGAGDTGEGSGAGAAGQGRGSGEGNGGGGGRRPTVKIRGEIDSAKDYPRATRQSRIGASVTIDLSVDTAGKVSACKVVSPSPDPAADRITCELATRRFRFRPALGNGGEPVEAVYRWRQRWFY